VIRFVTGTDTGVGKTVASAVLAHGAHRDGQRVRYLKPVQTGVASGAPGDADFVRAVAGVEAEELFRFDEPLSPAVAAERAGARIDFDSLTADVLLREGSCDLLLVEGAGGLLAPLAGNRPMADLPVALRAELVIAVRPGLGTLNHTALTLEAAERRGLPVAGLVVCGWPLRPGIAERTNFERLHAMAPVLAVVRAIRGVSVDGGKTSALKNALDRRTALVTRAV
jgi:dethiobiotin synthetase